MSQGRCITLSRKPRLLMSEGRWACVGLQTRGWWLWSRDRMHIEYADKPASAYWLWAGSLWEH
jgi:hypothetical protein